jgi:transcription elongation factor GreA-like protein
MSYSWFGGERIKSQVQISIWVLIFNWVLYYHRTLPTATSSFLREAIKEADQSDRGKKTKKMLDRVKGNIAQHT